MNRFEKEVLERLERIECLDKQILSKLEKPEPTSFTFVQIQGENMKVKLTNNTIQQGTTGRFLITPNAGSAFQTPPVPNVDATSAGLGITAVLESANDPTTGDPICDVAVPIGVPVGTQITLGGTDQTVAGLVTGTPLTVTVVAPVLPEPTSFSFQQIA